MKGMFLRWVKRVTKKAEMNEEQLTPEEVVKQAVSIALHDHVMQYPHSYFLRKGPKNIIFRGRW